MIESVRNIFTVNLGVRNNERVLVLTDTIREDEAVDEGERKKREALRRIARMVAEAGRRFAAVSYLEFPSTGSHGAEPPEEAWKAAFGQAVVERMKEEGIFEGILSKDAAGGDLEKARSIVRELRIHAVDCVIALTNYSTSHTGFRQLLTRCAGTRYASMPLFEEHMLVGVMTADWKEIERRTLVLVDRLGGADTVRITTPNGTSIRFSIRGRPVKADTGILTEPGSFSNLPAGEAFVAPVEGTAEGTMVLDWAPTRRLRSPVTLRVTKGLVTDVSGEEEFADELRRTIAANPLCGNIAELGVGTNEKATHADNILESEKILGTIHIALGDNSTFGGNVTVPFHQDFIFFDPTVEVEKEGRRELILKEGSLLV